ncbi:MAG: VOC family protein [Pseudonocardia sp.]|nr:VOC family protein [Pseudonocardia sp.]
MSRKLYVNLPVSDLDASVAFFTALGFTFDANFTDENATCMIVNEDTAVMLLVEKRFSDFTDKTIIDARTSTEVLFTISAESREEVDQLVRTAVANGGSTVDAPKDHGFMYDWGFQDVDGHNWGVMWMDMSQLPQE